jgi:hypothetical protein
MPGHFDPIWDEHRVNENDATAQRDFRRPSHEFVVAV